MRTIISKPCVMINTIRDEKCSLLIQIPLPHPIAHWTYTSIHTYTHTGMLLHFNNTRGPNPPPPKQLINVTAWGLAAAQASRRWMENDCSADEPTHLLPRNHYNARVVQIKHTSTWLLKFSFALRCQRGVPIRHAHQVFSRISTDRSNPLGLLCKYS